MKVVVRSMYGNEEGSVELPRIFSTPFRRDLIHKAYVNLDSHRFQPQGRHPTGRHGRGGRQ